MRIETKYKEDTIIFEIVFDDDMGREMCSGTILSAGVLDSILYKELTVTQIGRLGGPEQYVDWIVKLFNEGIFRRYGTAPEVPTMPDDVVAQVKELLKKLSFSSSGYLVKGS